MKKMACTELGGDCDFVMSAETCEGMIQEMWSHLTEKHPVLLSAIVSTNAEEWREAIRKEWELAPDVFQKPTYPNLM